MTPTPEPEAGIAQVAGACCRELLSQGLDLCVRGRRLDAIERRKDHLDWSMFPEEWLASGRFDQFVARNNIENPHAEIETRCLTPTLWAIDQYERDVDDWEGRTRKHLIQGCQHLTRAQGED